DLLHGEIHTHGRFAVHLCGHQHESASHEFSEAGAETQRIWQGCSLFGLELFGEHAKRSHGYAAGAIKLDKNEGFLSCWPRKTEQQGWETNLVPDYSLKLTDAQHTPPRRFALLQAYAKKPQKKKTSARTLPAYAENTAVRTAEPVENRAPAIPAKTAFRQTEPENFLETKTGTKDRVTARAITALLPYLLNRHPQIAALVEAIRNQRTNGPLLCFLHGHEYECHDKLIDRFIDHTLPGLEPDSGRNSVMRCRIECDIPGDRDSLHRQISMNLGEQLLGNLAASREEIAATIVQQRCPTVLFTDMHTKNWIHGGGVKTLHDFIAYWTDWPVPVERLLLVCLSFYYTESEKSGLFKRLFGKISANQSIKAEFEHLQTVKFIEEFKVDGVVLPELCCIEQEHAINWARNYLYDFSEELIPKIRELFSNYGSRCIAMEKIVFDLKALLKNVV
ncbi:MAG: hypothetical protein GY862_08730, partial [Gammaproteobacteria bacterium]|nr:hypothetical protein [Gammaproteobacteria bacterium]